MVGVMMAVKKIVSVVMYVRERAVFHAAVVMAVAMLIVLMILIC